MTAPLALRRQRANSSQRSQSFSRIADVVVDNGVFHLDEAFSYGVPDSLLDQVFVGSLVKVSFRDGISFGIVWAIREVRPEAVKPVTAVVDSFALSNPMISLIDELRDRYACSRHDLIRFAVTKKKLVSANTELESYKELGSVSFALLSHHELLERQVIKLVKSLDRFTLVICDTARTLRFLSQAMNEQNLPHVAIDPDATSAEQTKMRIHIRDLDKGVVIGLRSAIFQSAKKIHDIIVINEASSHHYEQKSPQWNTRDVALMRQRIEGFSLTFASASPSLELFRLIDSGHVKIFRPRKAIVMKKGRTLTPPITHITAIREGLKKGSVLVSIAEKSYVSSVICQRCRNLARCDCGGKYRLTSEKKLLCHLCSSTEKKFVCRECQATQFLMVRRGADRIAEELGKAFPGTPLQLVNSESAPVSQSVERKIFISTSGVEPHLDEGFAALILLDGEFLLNAPYLRAEEDLFSRWFSLMQLIKTDAPVFVSLPQSHRITQSIISRDPLRFLRSALAERDSIGMPPTRRLIRIAGEVRTLSSVRNTILSELPASIEVLPVSSDGRLVLKSPHDVAPALLHSLRVLQKYRSASKKDLLRIEVDPRDI